MASLGLNELMKRLRVKLYFKHPRQFKSISKRYLQRGRDERCFIKHFATCCYNGITSLKQYCNLIFDELIAPVLSRSVAVDVRPGVGFTKTLYIHVSASDDSAL